MEKRISFNIPDNAHMHLKMRAAQKGLSIKDYIMEALAAKEAAEDKPIDLDNETFKKVLDRTKKEYYDFAKKLAKL